MKKILTIIIVLVVLIGAYFLFFNTNNNEENIDVAPEQIVEEVVKDEGYCLENKLPKAAEDLVVGQEYGNFTYLGYEQTKIDEYSSGCDVKGILKFSGVATVSGSYHRSDMGGTIWFVVSEDDRKLFPAMIEEDDFQLHGNWTDNSFEDLFKYSSDEVYGEIGEATIKISDITYGYQISNGQYVDAPGEFYEEYLGLGLLTTITEIIENESEIGPHGYFKEN